MNDALPYQPITPSGQRGKLSLSTVCIAVMLLCALLTGYVPQALLSLVILAASVLLLTTEKIYLGFPIMLFYYEVFGLLAGMSVYRWFSLLFLCAIFLHQRSLRIRRDQIAPFLLFFVYCMIVVAPDDFRRAIFAVVDMVCILMLINYYLNEEGRLKKFFTVYVCTALCAFVTGIYLQRSLDSMIQVDGEWVEIVRNYATFEDPNYAGLFYTLAVFAMVTLRLFKPAVRIALIVAMYMIMMSTLSMTAVVVNLVLWLVYLITFRKINIKTGIILLLVIALLLGLYSFGLQKPDTPLIGQLSLRISEKLRELEQNDIDSLTSNRSDLTARHWNYFKEQSIFRMLVGMNAASTIKTDLDGFTEPAHNEYVDLLLNVGILGALLFLIVLLSRALTAFRKLMIRRDGYWGCVFMAKAIWVLYAMALTMFGDYRFMLLFFL